MHQSYLTITKEGCFGKDLTGIQAIYFESMSKFNYRSDAKQFLNCGFNLSMNCASVYALVFPICPLFCLCEIQNFFFSPIVNLSCHLLLIKFP